MVFREIVGLIILVAAATIFPFGYWIHRGWYLAAVVLACIGGLLFFSSRISRRASRVPTTQDHLDIPYIPGHLRGFPGAKITTRHETDLDIDGDGE